MTSPRWASRRTYHSSGSDRRNAASSSDHGALVLDGADEEGLTGATVEDAEARSTVADMLPTMSGRYIASVKGFILEGARFGQS